MTSTPCTTSEKYICPCSAPCPLKISLEIIGGKWKIPILCALHSDSPIRYNALKRKISGITNTMLASTLKELEASGLICRVQYMEMPIKVEYYATEQCKDLMPILWQLADWGGKIKK